MNKYGVMALGAVISMIFWNSNVTLLICIGIAVALFLVLNGFDISSLFKSPEANNEMDDDILDIVIETNKDSVSKGDEYDRLKTVQHQIRNNPHGIGAYVCAFRDELNPTESWEQYLKRLNIFKKNLSESRAQKYAENPEKYRTEYRSRLLAQ